MLFFLILATNAQAQEKRLPLKDFSLRNIHLEPDEYGLVTEKECDSFLKTPESSLKNFFIKAEVQNDLDYYGSLCVLSGELVTTKHVSKWRLFSNKIGVIDLGEKYGGEWLLKCPDCTW